MAKKTSNTNILTFATFILGIVAIIMLFLPCITIPDAEASYSGFQAIFGYSESNSFMSVEILKFSFMNLLSLILVAVGVLFTVLGALSKGGKFANLIATACFIVGAVFIFLMPSFTITSVSEYVKVNLSLGIGAIIGGIASALAGLIGAYGIFKK